VTSALNGTVVLYSGDDARFHIKRKFNCGTSRMDIDVSKAAETAQSATRDGDSSASMSYTDFEGAVRTVDALPSGDDCPTPVCTVQRAGTDTSRFSDGTNRSQTGSGTGVVETLVRQCTKVDGGTASCPVESGETIVEECSCTGSTIGMQKAITSLSVVSESAKDMICSQD